VLFIRHHVLTHKMVLLKIKIDTWLKPHVPYFTIMFPTLSCISNRISTLSLFCPHLQLYIVSVDGTYFETCLFSFYVVLDATFFANCHDIPIVSLAPIDAFASPPLLTY
ncbi:hypothetical protein CR513_48373, partial [Mucuna pruriens]